MTQSGSSSENLLISSRTRRKKHRKNTVISVEDVSIEDVEGEKTNVEKNSLTVVCKTEDWNDEDARWGRPPTVGRSTIVTVKILIGQLQDLDTVRGTLYARIGLWSTGKTLDWQAGAEWILFLIFFGHLDQQ